MINTAQEAYEYILRGLQKEGADTLAPDEFNHTWNSAQLDYVTDRYWEFERNQKRLDDLQTIIPAPLTLANAGGQGNSLEVFNLPVVVNPGPGVSAGYLFMLSVCQRIVQLNAAGVMVQADCATASGCATSRLLSRDQRHELEREPFSWPTVDEPYHTITENTVRTVTPAGTWTNEIVIEYLRHPVEVDFANNIDPELPPHANKEIADIAIRKRLEVYESRRHQTITAEQQLSNR